MTAFDKTVVVQRSKNHLFGAFCIAAFALGFGMVLLAIDAHYFWWAALFVATLMLARGMLRTPKEIVFHRDDATIELKFLFGAIAPEHKIYKFSDWVSIQSRVRVDDENQRVWLELVDGNGKTLVLSVDDVEFDDAAGSWLKLGWGAYREPKSIKALRLQIGQLTGLKDLGFRGQA